MNPKEAVGKFVQFVKRGEPEPVDLGPGYTAFVRASGNYPSCVWAQAPSIALYCFDNSYSPMVIGRDLYYDKKQVSYLREVAKKAHKVNAKGPKPPSRWLILGVIDTSFSVADILMNLDRPIIEGFLEMHDRLKAEGISLRNVDIKVGRELNWATGIDLGKYKNYPHITD